VIKVKICGLSRVEDVLAANEAMPEYIGFVFAKSTRQVSAPTAKMLKEILDPGIKAVGVFVDEAIENILELKDVIDVVQLHGNEDKQYIKKLKSKIEKPIIKAIGVTCCEDIKKAEKLPVDYLLLDNARGGSGEKFDWSLIDRVKKPFFLAGGLDLENVTEALKLKPYAVDVSSGVETDGLKDKEKILRFVRSVKDE
jgi:phosphoribosylanthranilate isomerase